ncbi:transglutaminase-like domain-containing protein [Gammaproteobacteria bacterium]|nr:transglutaminase-like domain-containing protein [Gammaproteobacteria bacterium]
MEVFDQLKSIGSHKGNLHDIGGAAVLLAQIVLPGVGLRRYCDELDLISSDMSLVSSAVTTLDDQIKVVQDVVYTGHGYHGDIASYDDPDNANLMRVIDRKKGLPVALGILVIHAARSQGWNIAGLNFPGHFLLRLSKLGEHAIINPFPKARLILPDEMEQLLKRVYGSNIKLSRAFIKTVSDHDILIRLQNNIKIRAVQAGNNKRATEVLMSMNLIAPTNSDILLELALSESAQGNYQGAIKRLTSFLESNPKTSNKASILDLKGKLNQNLN